MFTSSNCLLKMLYSYKASLVIMVAHKEGIFNLLANKSVDAKSLANLKGWQPQQTRVFLNILVNLHMLDCLDGRYSCAESTLKFLLPEKETYLGDLIEIETKFYEEMINVDSVINGLKGHGTLFPEKYNESYMRAMEYGVRYAAINIVRVAKRYSPLKKMLDLGGGPGQIAVTFCRFNDQTEATVFDLPNMRKYAEKNIKAHQLQKRIQVRSGDCVKDKYGEDYDVIVISNLLHFFNIREIIQILNQAYNSLIQGGIVIIHDFFIGEVDNEVAQLSAIDWLVMGAAFDYSLDDFTLLVKDNTQFKVIYSQKIIGPPTSMIILQK